MSPYICLTYARGNNAEATRLADTLTSYGYACRALHEASDPSSRQKILQEAALVLALTSPEAHNVGTVAADLRLLPEKGRAPLCISLGENPIDDAFCHQMSFERRNRLAHIPYPAGETPDPTTVGLFIHRLFICHIARIREAYDPAQCRRDRLGRTIALAISAHAGDRDAAYALGCAYERGDVLPVLESEAAAWIIRAADAGHPDARLHLGELFLTGWGVEPDEARAFELFSSVADEGDVRGAYRLALCYLNGAGVVPDPTRAVSHLRRAARWGYAPALYRLGLLARDGVGMPPDARLALRCFYRACVKDAAAEARKIAEETAQPASEVSSNEKSILIDSTTTLFDLLPEEESDAPTAPAILLPIPPLNDPHLGRRAAAVTTRHVYHHIEEKHRLGLRADTVSAFRYQATYHSERAWLGSLTRSSRVTVAGGVQASGHPVLDMSATDVAMGVPFDRSNAALALARLLTQGDPSTGLMPHPTRALPWYRYALRHGNTEALYWLADAYSRGLGTPADPAFATVLYRIAADWSDPRGQFALAVAYERGLGVETDMSKAIHHYLQAALAGHAPAQNNLGACYEHGIGVARNELTAIEWYARAAEAGLPEAMCRLGLCYETGRGVTVDPDRAFDLYQRAAEQKHPYAFYRLGVCHDRRGDYTQAIRCWQTAAEAGLAEASYVLSACYSVGHGVRRDMDLAVRSLCDAARGNSLQAICRLAVCFAEGAGVARNTTRALECLQYAVQLFRTRKLLYTADKAPFPACAYTPLEAAGNALYLLGLATLESWDSTTNPIPASTRQENATALFTEAAEIGHVGALIALGDLYAHGILTDESDSARKALSYYERAARVSAARRGVPSPIGEDESVNRMLAGLSLPTYPATGTDPRAHGLLSSSADTLGVNASPALLSLADDAVRYGHELHADGATVPAAEVFDTAWRCYAAAVELGSTDARVGMAECLFSGLGRASDPEAAIRLLQTVSGDTTPRVITNLWLGDLLRNLPSPEEADLAYCRGLAAPTVESEVGPYVLSERRRARAALDERARAALLYRLATLRAIYPPAPAASDDPTSADRSAFSLLCESVLTGHTAAREDLARMYTYERRYSLATAPAEPTEDQGSAKKKHRFFLRRRPRQTAATAPAPLRDHAMWLSDYYTALWLRPTPFTYDLRASAVPDEVPAHVTAAVTPVMLADALNYIGDCFFYGRGLPHRPSAAVSCYRQVTDLDLRLARGEAPPDSVIWARYSLGWCLLHGKGVRKGEREAVRWLTAASKTHPEACYDLGTCFELGLGVDGIDLPEAAKCYRRAVKLGHPLAARKVKQLERQERLLERANEAD